MSQFSHPLTSLIIAPFAIIIAASSASSFLNISLSFAASETSETKNQWPGLFEVQSIGSLREFSLVSAKPCKDCSHERAIFLLPPRTPTSRYTLFVYPGKVTDPKNHQVILESRSFYGRCLTATEDAYVVFQKERVDKRKGPQSSVFIATPSMVSGSPVIAEKLLERKLPNLKNTLKHVKEKRCFEIPGRNRVALKKPLDVPPPPGSSDDANDDNEENDKPKENQDTLKAET